MNYKIEVIRAKDNGYRLCDGRTDGTEADYKKMFNSWNLFLKAGLFKAIKITDESGKVTYQKGDF
ncbi:MAG: hypothetical protein J6V90_08050 [Treponema sp.]|nr:hypothetical protein [Treponema sp.]